MILSRSAAKVDWLAPKVMVFDPLFRVSLTGTERITCPPPVSG